MVLLSLIPLAIDIHSKNAESIRECFPSLFRCLETVGVIKCTRDRADHSIEYLLLHLDLKSSLDFCGSLGNARDTNNHPRGGFHSNHDFLERGTLAGRDGRMLPASSRGSLSRQQTDHDRNGARQSGRRARPAVRALNALTLFKATRFREKTVI